MLTSWRCPALEGCGLPALREPLTVTTWIWHSGVTVANPSHPYPHPSSYRQPQALVVPPQRLLPASVFAPPAPAVALSGVSLLPVSKCPLFLD